MVKGAGQTCAARSAELPKATSCALLPAAEHASRCSQLDTSNRTSGLWTSTFTASKACCCSGDAHAQGDGPKDSARMHLPPCRAAHAHHYGSEYWCTPDKADTPATTCINQEQLWTSLH